MMGIGIPISHANAPFMIRSSSRCRFPGQAKALALRASISLPV